MREVAIGVDIGGTKIHFAVVGRHGDIIRQHIEPTPAREGAEQIMNAVVGGIERMLRATEDGAEPLQVKGIGIGSAGQINFNTGIVEYAVDTLPGWTGTRIKPIVETRFPYPVYVDNDVNVIAVAEKMYGAGSRLRHFICLALGTGVGGAIVESGHIVRGAFGGAGELGHISVDFNGPRCSCGNYGCLEQFASGTGIARVAREMIAAQRWSVAWAPDSRSVLAAWHEGDAYAAQVMDVVIRALSAAIAGLIHTFNPEAVIIGGGVAETGDRFMDEIVRHTEARTGSAMWRAVRIVPAKVGNSSGVIGAAAQLWHYDTN